MRNAISTCQFFPRIGIGDSGNVPSTDTAARVGEQRAIERSFDHARFEAVVSVRRASTPELVGDQQTAAPLTIEQMMPARNPKSFICVSVRPGDRGRRDPRA